MLSRKTLTVLSLVHAMGVFFRVIPFQFNARNSGMNGRCDLVYQGAFWQRNVYMQIMMRFLIAGVFFQNVLYNVEMMPCDIGVKIFAAVTLLTSARLICFYVSHTDETIQFLNQFLRLNQQLGKFKFVIN